MYSPALFTSDSFNLWNPASYSSTKPNDTEDTKQARHLFAPPMQAYSTDFPGAYVHELEYTIQTMTSTKSKMGLITPLVQRKIDQLESVRNFGYNSIRPVGINKTLEELEFEQMKRNNMSEVDDSSYHTIENTNNSRAEPEQDLDAQIENFDDGDTSGDVEVVNNNINISNNVVLNNNDILSDDGFMADDVEYQVDHSLNHQQDIAVSPTFTSNMRSATTNQTTLPSATSPVAVSAMQNENGHANENEEHENEDMDMTMD